MQNDFIFFLESLKHTGIYIIDRESMIVYYENETAQKYTGENRIGRPCYLAHGNKSMCASCPLRKEDRESMVIREDHKMIFSVKATETMWQGKEVYAIIVQKQTDIPMYHTQNAELSRRMNRALKQSVLSYCEINMKSLQSRDVHFSARDNGTVLEESYEEHLHRMCEHFVLKEDQQRVFQTMGITNLQRISADSTGLSEISIRYRSSGVNGTKGIAIESTAYFLRDELPHYVSIITKEVTAEENMNMRLQLYSGVQQNSVALFRFNLTDNQYLGNRKSNVALHSNFEELYASRSMSEFFERIIKNVPEGEMRKGAKKFFNREFLLRAFDAGKKSMLCTFPFYIQKGRSKWLRFQMNMVQSALTNEVEGILHVEQIENRIMKDNLIAQVINNDYDFIVLIDRQDNTARIYKNNVFGDPQIMGNAEQMMQSFLRRNLAEDDIGGFIRKNEFDYVLKQLEEQEQYIEYYYVQEDDGIHYKKGTYSYSNGDKRYLIFSRTDNTEAVNTLKTVNEQLSQALEQSDNANRAKIEIFSRMSHDLRTPMNAIVGMAKLGMDEKQWSDSAHYFEKIEVSGNYLLGLINDILDMNKLENDKVTLHEEAVDIKKFLYDVVEIIYPLIEQRQINLHMDFSRIPASYMFCDVVRTRQVYINFLSNAIKFSEPGSSVWWSTKDGKVENGRVYYAMSFVDHGCGMSKEFQERAFEPFEQETNPYSNENSSTGLGLAITKNLVDIMGGSIEVESEKGKGSTFTLHLSHPMARKEDIAVKIQMQDYEYLKGKRVLAVEDHPLNSEIEQKLLEKKDMKVVMARDGQEAVTIFEQSRIGQFDAILMDVRMPVMDGLEATRRIRSLNRADAKNIPIIATTANAFDEDREATRRAGMSAHLSKPIIPKELYSVLQNCIAGAE